MRRGIHEAITVYRSAAGWSYSVSHGLGTDGGYAPSEEEAWKRARTIADRYRGKFMSDDARFYHTGHINDDPPLP